MNNFKGGLRKLQIGTVGTWILQTLCREPKKVYIILTVTAECDQIESHFKAVPYPHLS